MKRYLLDTNVISELRKPRPHSGVVAWINDLQEGQLFLSAVTTAQADCDQILRDCDGEIWNLQGTNEADSNSIATEGPSHGANGAK